MKRYFYPTILCLCCFLVGFAQQARQYSFRHFSVSNGLASNTVNKIVQDSDGYIWIATMNGLQRYDGNSFLTFQNVAHDPASLPSSHITSLFVDRSKNLWVIGNNGKLGIFDTKKFVFREIPVAFRNRSALFPYEYLELPGGELVLRSVNGLFRYDKKRKVFLPDDQIIPRPPGWKDLFIHWDAARRKYWISSDSGVVQYNPATKNLNYRGHNPDRDPVIEAVKNIRFPSQLLTDKSNNLIINHWPPGTSSPVITRYSAASKKREDFAMGPSLNVYHEIKGFLLQSNGKLWVHGMPFFVEWTDGEKPFTMLKGENLDEPRIKYDYAYHALEDREQNIWISTDNGVYLFNPDAQIFNTYGLLRPGDAVAIERPVTSVNQLKDGRIFIGTWGSSGLYCFDNQFKPIALPKALGKAGKSYSVWDMAVNPKTGALWITLQGGGLVVYDPQKETVVETYPEIFKRSTIRQVDEDTSGNMWFGTHNGKLIKWDRRLAGDDPTKGYQVVHQTGLILKVHYDYKGFIWVGTQDWGLIKVDAKTNKVVTIFRKEGPKGKQLFSNLVSDMTYYNDSTLVVVAECLNILNTRTNTITFMSDEDGLPSNSGESVEKDSKGIIWMGMTNGISRVNLKKKLVSFYDRRDGLAYDKFSKAGVQELNDGRLVFFTDHNFLVFDPANIEQQSNPPKAQLTALKVGGKPLLLDSILQKGMATINYDNTSIGISFSALSYLQQTKLHYYYMLEGVDEDWIHSDKPMEVVYNHLAPGDYTFRVKSESADGITSPDIVEMEIFVRPPFWKTWWFYGLVILLVITILYVIDKERMNKRNSLRAMRRQIAGNLHTEISKTLNNINVLSEIAKIRADKNIEQSKEFIGQISNKSRYMIEAMDDMLWSIDPQNDSMRKTVLRIKELTDNMRSSYDVDIDLIVDHKIQSLELDMKFRHDLYFFYKEAMLFLLKNIACSQLFININQVKTRVMIEIIAECNEGSDDCVDRFKKAVHARTEALRGNLDAIADASSFSAVLYVNV